jgi:hypothetical protein
MIYSKANHICKVVKYKKTQAYFKNSGIGYAGTKK